jgi:hypothetical protein
VNLLAAVKRQRQLKVMPWRLKTLTEYKASEGASPDNSDQMPVSDGTGLNLVGQHGNVETSDVFSSGYTLDDTGFGGNEPCGFDVTLESPTGSNPFEAQQVSRNSAVVALGASQVPRGPVISESSFEQLLSHAYLGTRGPLTVKMPWERGVFKKIFQKPASGIQHVFQQPRVWVNYNLDSVAETLEDLRGSTVSQPELVGAFFEHALTAVSDMSFQQQRTSLLETAVEKWFCIIRVNMLASSTGRDIISFGNMDDQKRGAFETIEAVIGIRSRTTAITRANSLLKFLRWRAECSDNGGRPFEEQEAWQYLRELRETGAAPTKGSSFLSACAYAFHVFGFNGLESICNSKSLRGLADLMHAVKAPLRSRRWSLRSGKCSCCMSCWMPQSAMWLTERWLRTSSLPCTGDAVTVICKTLKMFSLIWVQRVATLSLQRGHIRPQGQCPRSPGCCQWSCQP